MAFKYRHEGFTIDYTPTSAVAAGDVVVIGGRLTGVAHNDIPANTLGALTANCLKVFEADKASAATVFAVGAGIDDDGSGAAIAGNKFVAVKASANGDPTVWIALMPPDNIV